MTDVRKRQKPAASAAAAAAPVDPEADTMQLDADGDADADADAGGDAATELITPAAAAAATTNSAAANKNNAAAPAAAVTPSPVSALTPAGWMSLLLRIVLLFALFFGPAALYLYATRSRERVFSVSELASFDGESGRPLYLAIKGEVFDVTTGRSYYGKGAGYGGFAGKDASRSFVTGCYTPRGLTHDLRGLNADQIKAIDDWAEFYQKHDKYKKVGLVKLPVIPADAPMPDDCKAPDPEAEAKAIAAREKAIQNEAAQQAIVKARLQAEAEELAAAAAASAKAKRSQTNY